MEFNPDRCRSLLFVPAGKERYFKSALTGDADVIQLDLEDAIPPDQKQQARKAARDQVNRIDAANRVGVVRINHNVDLQRLDLEAVVGPGLAGLTIPKVSSGDELKQIDEEVSRLETNCQLPVGEIRLVAQIESAAGVLNAREIANSTPRLAAMGFGMEDLAVELGSQVNHDALYFPSMLTLYAAREAAVTPIGFLGSITNYQDIQTFTDWIQRAKFLGFEGGFCIHPNQVEILNSEFIPSQSEVDEARALVQAFETRTDKTAGAFAYQGRMVDKPVVERAKRTLQRAAF